MSGTFFLHYIFTAVAILITVLPIIWKRCKTKSVTTNEIENALTRENEDTNVNNAKIRRQKQDKGHDSTGSSTSSSQLKDLQEMLNVQAKNTTHLSRNNNALMQDAQTLLKQL
mmetsp:Transcript_29097/g.44427  ORF Transcript_29097/g.44427 Transcript_29097/m.44427 type:complete len:113 (+) Transcript_29097:664-1002(+)